MAGARKVSMAVSPRKRVRNRGWVGHGTTNRSRRGTLALMVLRLVTRAASALTFTQSKWFSSMSCWHRDLEIGEREWKGWRGA